MSKRADVWAHAGATPRQSPDVPPLMTDALPPVMLDATGKGGLMRLLEATPGIEPGYTVLQTVA